MTMTLLVNIHLINEKQMPENQNPEEYKLLPETHAPDKIIFVFIKVCAKKLPECCSEWAISLQFSI